MQRFSFWLQTSRSSHVASGRHGQASVPASQSPPSGPVVVCDPEDSLPRVPEALSSVPEVLLSSVPEVLLSLEVLVDPIEVPLDEEPLLPVEFMVEPASSPQAPARAVQTAMKATWRMIGR